MKKLIFAIMLMCVGPAVNALTHTVTKGENLKAIAEKYNVTIAQLLEANPGVESLFFIGMKLTVPENAAASAVAEQTQHAAAQPRPDTATVTEPENRTFSRISATDFGHIFINYAADPEAFDKGFYGIGFSEYGDSGFGGTFSVHGNWGIVDKGQLMFKFGPAYGYPVNQYLMVNAALRGFIYTYDKKNGRTATSTDQKVNGGITITPGVTLKLDRFFIDADFELGWCHDFDKLYKNIEVGIGYKF